MLFKTLKMNIIKNESTLNLLNLFSEYKRKFFPFTSYHLFLSSLNELFRVFFRKNSSMAAGKEFIYFFFQKPENLIYRVKKFVV